MAIKFKYKKKKWEAQKNWNQNGLIGKKVKIREPFQNALGQTGESTG